MGKSTPATRFMASRSRRLPVYSRTWLMRWSLRVSYKKAQRIIHTPAAALAPHSARRARAFACGSSSTLRARENKKSSPPRTTHPPQSLVITSRSSDDQCL
jgi:hypothetical protein